MQPFDPSGRYGDTAVLQALQGLSGARTVDFRFDLLNRFNQVKAPLVGVLPGATVSYDSMADVKRNLTGLRIREGYDTVDYLSDRVKPWFRLLMPDGGWVEWPLGVFLLSSPTRSLDTTGAVIRTVDAYDQLVIIAADAVADRYSIPAGQRFVAAIQALLQDNGFTALITASELTLPVTWDYEAGTSKLTILNDLLSAMNYRSAWFDEAGNLVCEPFVLPELRTIGYTYATDASSVIVGQIDQTLDLFNVPNRWTLVVSDTDQGSFSSTFTNTDPASPTSTVSRGRVILSFDAGQSAADQATLDGLVRKKAYEDSNVYEQVPFNTALMPFHSNADILGITVYGLGVVGVKYAELSWSLPLQVGGTMSHVAQRTISVNPLGLY